MCSPTKLCSRLPLTRIILVTWLIPEIITLVWIGVVSERSYNLILAVFTLNVFSIGHLPYFLLRRYLGNKRGHDGTLCISGVVNFIVLEAEFRTYEAALFEVAKLTIEFVILTSIFHGRLFRVVLPQFLLRREDGVYLFLQMFVLSTSRPSDEFKTYVSAIPTFL